MEVTGHASDMSICEQSFHGDSSSVRQIFSKCVQENDEEKSSYCQEKSSIKSISDKPNIKSSDGYEVAVYNDPYFKERIKIKLVFDDYESFSEDEVYRFDGLNSEDGQERNMQRSILGVANFDLSDVYDVNKYVIPNYEGRIKMDDEKSSLEPEVCLFGEFNSTDVQGNNQHILQSAINPKKHTTNKSESSDECETQSDASNHYYASSDSSDENEVPAKEKKNKKSKKTPKKNTKDTTPEQSAATCKKHSSSKKDSSDEHITSSDSSDDEEMPSPDSSVEWEKPSSESSDELEMQSTTSNDSYGSSGDSQSSEDSEIIPKKNQKPEKQELTEYEKMIQKNRDEKFVFLQSLRIDEVKGDLKNSVKNLKPKRPLSKIKSSNSTSQEPSRKSVRLAGVRIDFSEKALERKASSTEDTINKKTVCLRQSSVNSNKLTAKKIHSSNYDDYSSSVDLDIYSTTSNDDYSSSVDLDIYSTTSNVDHNSVNSYKVAPKERENQKPKKEELTEYEKMVQKNRDEKFAFLKSLRMDEVKQDLNEAIKNRKPKRTYKRSNNVSTPQGPLRKSLRKKERLPKVHIVFPTTSRCKKELPPILTFEKATLAKDAYDDFVQNFDDLDFETPKPFTDHVSSFANMKLDESKIRVVYRGGTLSAMTFHPMKEKVIVTSGNTKGVISFWQGTADSVPYTFQPHISRVSCIKFSADFMNQVISCSTDGTMRCGDMEKRVFKEVYKTADKTHCNYFDFISPVTTVVCHKNGDISVVDIRSDRKSANMSQACHELNVCTVSVHPVNNNYFVSADLAGLLCLWDLRKFIKKPVLEVSHYFKSRTMAFFSPVTGNSILTVQNGRSNRRNENTVRIYDCSKLGNAISLYRKVRAPTHSLHLVNIQPAWLPNTDDVFVIGSFNAPHRIDVYNNQLDNVYNFQDEHFISTSEITVFHPSLPLLAGGNQKGGKVYIFS